MLVSSRRALCSAIWVEEVRDIGDGRVRLSILVGVGKAIAASESIRYTVIVDIDSIMPDFIDAGWSIDITRDVLQARATEVLPGIAALCLRVK